MFCAIRVLERDLEENGQSIMWIHIADLHTQITIFDTPTLKLILRRSWGFGMPDVRMTAAASATLPLCVSNGMPQLRVIPASVDAGEPERVIAHRPQGQAHWLAARAEADRVASRLQASPTVGERNRGRRRSFAATRAVSDVEADAYRLLLHL